MTWFVLPPTSTDRRGAFVDAKSAASWLASQPRANASAMLEALVPQLDALNVFSLSPRERFKTLEALRKLAFAVSAECQRRYESKPLPLPASERELLGRVCRLWRALATGYLHCLRPCLDGDPSIAAHASRVAHRVLVCLRLEQANCYAASVVLGEGFWARLHAVLASAEQLGVLGEPIEDRLLGETCDSTIGGQYAMVLLLFLAQPYGLTRNQLLAVTRWFTRWREQAKLLREPESNPASCCLALDLAQDRALHDNLRAAEYGRWLSISNLLRKIRQRLDRLAAGETPESLKLGSALSAEACMALLAEVADKLKYPPLTATFRAEEGRPVAVAVGMENIFRLLGGKGLADPHASASSYDTRVSQEQLAIFGHVVRPDDHITATLESWRFLRQESDEWRLLRLATDGASRMSLGGLLAIETDEAGRFVLVTIASMFAEADGSLCVGVAPFSSSPEPLLVELKERPSGKLSHHPALVLAEEEGGPLLVLPLGLTANALALRFFDARDRSPVVLRSLRMIGRGGDNERWLIALDAQ